MDNKDLEFTQFDHKKARSFVARYNFLVKEIDNPCYSYLQGFSFGGKRYCFGYAKYVADYLVHTHNLN